MIAEERPKLLVLTSTFPRWSSDNEPRFIERLSLELAKSFRVVVLAPHCRGSLTHEVIGNGLQSIEVHRYRYSIPAWETLAYEGGILDSIRRKPWRFLLLPFFLVSQLFSAIRLHRRYRFDLVHAHWIVPQGLTAVAMRGFTRHVPSVLVTSHGSDLFALRGRILNRLKKWVLKRANAVSVVSEAMKQHCVERQYARNVIVQSMGADLDSLFVPGDGQLNREGLVYVGRLVEVKGVDQLIRAMALLVKRFPDLGLTIVGDGPLRDELGNLAARLDLQNNIRFSGAVLHEDVPRFLRAAAIFVLPSRQEGLGLVAVEAMGCGCAVVASDLPSVRDAVIDGKTGLTANAANPEDLAEKITRLLLDEELRNTLANAGRRHAVDHFAWKTVGQRYTELLNGMLR